MTLRLKNNKLLNASLYLVFLIIIGTVIYVYKPYPTDDFLRQIRFTDYADSGGYSYMFPHSFFEKMKYNPWYGFDMLAGAVKSMTGLHNTVLIFEIAIISLYIIALLVNLRSCIDDDGFAITCIFLFVFLSCVLERLFLIRPALLVGSLFLIGIRGRGGLAGFIWILAAAPLYWLFWLYSIPLSIAHYIKGDKKFALSLLLGTIVALIYWIGLTNGEYVSYITSLVSSLLGGRSGITVSENKLSLGRLANPVMLLTVFAFTITYYRERKKDIYLALILLTIPLAIQLRYFMDLTLPLMFIYALTNNTLSLRNFYLKYKPVVETMGLVSVVLILPPIMAFSYNGEKTKNLKGINLPEGSVVFADELPLNFNVVFFNEAKVKVIPSPEIGWNNSATIENLKDIWRKGKIDDSHCRYFTEQGIQYAVTGRKVESHCLEHLKTFSQHGNAPDIGLYKVLFSEKTAFAPLSSSCSHSPTSQCLLMPPKIKL